MNEEKKYPSFTASDIEKYYKGQLSAKEMHDMEKAALDDPLLADALEGYSIEGVNANADIEELKKRLAAKLQSGKVIAIGRNSKSNFPWLRVAVMIILIAGAGLWVYQFAINKKAENSIAKSERKATEEIKTTDSNNAASPAITNTENSTATNDTREKENSAAGKGQADRVTITNQNNSKAAINNDGVSNYITTTNAGRASTAPASPSGDAGLLNKKNEAKNDDAIANLDMKEKAAEIKQDAESYGAKDTKDEDTYRANGAVTLKTLTQNQRSNNFRGRIIDPNNNPVPFASVTNTQDNVATYSDAKGYFNLISPDSVLNVQIRSVGYDNNNTQLRGDVINNQVVLQEDRSSLAEVVISSKKPNATARARDANIKVEEPEPADGWDNYDTYLLNNLHVPDEIKTSRGMGDVALSFEVDKKGVPVNIKVEKSLCEKCDQEAIRLIKEGPKWKPKVRKSRASVTIPF